MTIRVGIGGWTYEPWRGPFYPPDHLRKRELADGADSIETFLTQGFTELGDWLYPILWQFAATKRFERDDVETGYDIGALDSWAQGGREVFAFLIVGAEVRNPATA